MLSPPPPEAWSLIASNINLVNGFVLFSGIYFKKISILFNLTTIECVRERWKLRAEIKCIAFRLGSF